MWAHKRHILCMIDPKKVIAVFFDDPAEDGYPFDSEEYRTSYKELASLIHQKGGRFVIARGQDSYKYGTTFSHYWDFDGKNFYRVNEPITVDVIYDKAASFKADSDAILVNDPVFHMLCTDKSKTADQLGELMPESIIVNSAKDILPALEKIKTDMVVAKPLDGAEGRGVLIQQKKVIAEHIKEFPYILQEFIDTSGGIPGLIDGVHDFRIVCINADIILSYMRKPPGSSLIANVALGGQEIEVLLKDIPAEARAIFAKVNSIFKVYPRRLYSIDMGRDKSGSWKVIELNSQPGLSPLATGKSYEVFYEKLADFLLSIE